MLDVVLRGSAGGGAPAGCGAPAHVLPFPPAAVLRAPAAGDERAL